MRRRSDAAGPPASVPLRKSFEAGVMEQGDVERSLSFAHIVCAYRHEGSEVVEDP